MIAGMTGDRGEATMRARRALAAYEAAGDIRGRAVATLQIVRVATLEPGEDLRLLRRVIAEVREVGDRSIEARALHSLADHLFTAASYEEAFEVLTEAAAAFEETGDRLALGRVYNSMGRLYRAHQRSDEALKFQLAALAIHETTDSPFELLQSLNAVAVTHQTLGNPAQARVYLERALALAERTSSPRIQDFLRANLVSTSDRTGSVCGGSGHPRRRARAAARRVPEHAHARSRQGLPEAGRAATRRWRWRKRRSRRARPAVWIACTRWTCGPKSAPRRDRSTGH